MIEKPRTRARLRVLSSTVLGTFVCVSGCLDPLVEDPGATEWADDSPARGGVDVTPNSPGGAVNPASPIIDDPRSPAQPTATATATPTPQDGQPATTDPNVESSDDDAANTEDGAGTDGETPPPDAGERPLDFQDGGVPPFSSQTGR